MHQRNPSMTPTIGLREYSKRHCSGTTLELKPTGDTYSPNCTMKGMTYRKSRYLTLRAVIHRAGPTLAKNANTIKTGRSNIRQSGKKLYHAISRTRMKKLMRKSTKATTTVAIGTINRGK